MSIKEYITWLRAHGACEEAIAWSEARADFAACWRECEDTAWLLWLLDHAKILDDRRARLFGCWCVRQTPLADGRVVWDLLTDERSRTAVEVAERYAIGEATDGELSAAWIAAWYATGIAAWSAAWTAAWYAAWSAARSAAWSAARSAAWSAGSAGSAARNAARYAGDVARNAAEITQCARIREVWPVDEVAAGIAAAITAQPIGDEL